MHDVCFCMIICKKLLTELASGEWQGNNRSLDSAFYDVLDVVTMLVIFFEIIELCSNIK
jgi:hypothetical protein